MKKINTDIDYIDNIDAGNPVAKRKNGGSKKLFKRLRLKAFVLLMFFLTVAFTYAWYTSSASAFMTIQSGTLVIGARSWSLQPDDSDVPVYLIPGFDGADGFRFADDPNEKNLRIDPNAIFDDFDWEPNIDSVFAHTSKLLQVSNEGTVPANIKLYFNVDDDMNLGEAIWYDFIPLDSTGAAVRNYERKLIETLADDADELPVYWLDVGEVQQFILVYGMCPWAGNEYQNRTIWVDLEIRAVQDSAGDQAVDDVLQ